MSKNKIITTLIACAVICSVLAGYLIYHFMSPQRGTIYVFNAAYSAGDQITSSMLTPIQVDANIVVAGRKDSVSSRFITPNEYASIVKSGDSLRMDVSEGMPLTTAMLSVQGGSTVEMNMRSDAIAVTVPVDRFTGITNDLKEGARVNVYSVYNSVTVLIQQNKRVLEVYKEKGAIVGVALEESIQESMELISAAKNASIYLGLVDATGYQSAEGEDPYYLSDISPYLTSSDGEPAVPAEDPEEYGVYSEYQEDEDLVSALNLEEPEPAAETEAPQNEETEKTGTDTVFTP